MINLLQKRAGMSRSLLFMQDLSAVLPVPSEGEGMHHAYFCVAVPTDHEYMRLKMQKYEKISFFCFLDK